MSDQIPVDPVPEPNPRLRLEPVPAVRRQAPETYVAPREDDSLGEEVHLLDYVKVLYKRRWTVFSAFSVVTISVAVYLFTATPIYEAKTRLLIESEEQNV